MTSVIPPVKEWKLTVCHVIGVELTLWHSLDMQSWWMWMHSVVVNHQL